MTRSKTSKQRPTNNLPDGLPDDLRSPPPEARGFPRTDTGNAERLIARFGDRLHWCDPWKRWLVWDGRRWALDDTLQHEAWGKQTVRSIIREAAFEEDDGLRSELARWAAASDSAFRRKRMLECAASEHGIPLLPDAFDRDRFALNLLNGTLDLRAGSLREPRAGDLNTKLAPVAYDLAAACPRWSRFLREIMLGDEELVSYLQRCVGYSLTGDTREQCFFVLYGQGSNGKSTFVNAIKSCLGDYANVSDFETFCTRRSEGPRNDIADLRGSRFVAATETDEGRRLAEGLLKRLTGKDESKVRFLHQEHFRFDPTFKVWLAANHKPAIYGTDDAIWRRVRLIPFLAAFKGTADDKELDLKLSAELPGILNWALAGCLAWQRDGLGLPRAVNEATTAYQRDSDPLGDFLEDHCLIGPALREEFGALYAAYTTWTKANNEPTLSGKAFGLRLDEKGCHAHRDRQVRWRVGLALKVDEEVR